MSTSLRRCRLAGAVCPTRAPNPDRAFGRVGGQPQDQREVAGRQHGAQHTVTHRKTPFAVYGMIATVQHATT